MSYAGAGAAESANLKEQLVQVMAERDELQRTLKRALLPVSSAEHRKYAVSLSEEPDDGDGYLFSDSDVNRMLVARAEKEAT